MVAEGPRRTGSSARVSIPETARLVEAVLESSTGKNSSIHGESHSQRVAAAGLALLPKTPEADPALVFLFALFHDSMRLNDNHDPMHGPRGAPLARKLRGGPFDLNDAQMDVLAFACEEHTNGGVGPDPTVGVCWDADRLNLWRVGITPDPRRREARSASRGLAPCRVSISPGRNCIGTSGSDDSSSPRWGGGTEISAFRSPESGGPRMEERRSI